jgi:hypothetical protein
VCISSEEGAGGFGAAHLVARELRLAVIDEEIITRAAVEAGIDKEVVVDVERRTSMLVRLLEGLGSTARGQGLACVGADVLLARESAEGGAAREADTARRWDAGPRARLSATVRS